LGGGMESNGVFCRETECLAINFKNRHRAGRTRDDAQPEPNNIRPKTSGLQLSEAIQGRWQSARSGPAPRAVGSCCNSRGGPYPNSQLYPRMAAGGRCSATPVLVARSQPRLVLTGDDKPRQASSTAAGPFLAREFNEGENEVKPQGNGRFPDIWRSGIPWTNTPNPNGRISAGPRPPDRRRFERGPALQGGAQTNLPCSPPVETIHSVNGRGKRRTQPQKKACRFSAKIYKFKRRREPDQDFVFQQLRRKADVN